MENILDKNFIKIIKGIVISCIVTLLLLFIYALLLRFTNIGENTISPVIIAITGVSILIGSSIGAGSIKKNGIINGGIIGLTYIILLYLLSSLTGTGFALNMYSIILMCVSAGAGAIGGIVGVNLK